MQCANDSTSHLHVTYYSNLPRILAGTASLLNSVLKTCCGLPFLSDHSV
jgi:hypothetical protein